MLEVKNLNKSVGEKKILRDVSFSVQRGKIGVFLGGSGVGKSTLFRVLNHLESCCSGTVCLDGHPLDLSIAGKDQTIGMVFQQFNLFDHLTVEQNIKLALIKLKKKSSCEAKQIAHELLDKFHLLDKATSYANKLSGGQKQRLAIARSLALNPQIICLDEPSSALDPLLTSQIAKYIVELASENRMVLVSTHDISLIEQFESTLFLMKEGTIAETSSLSEYMLNPSKYSLLDQYLAKRQAG